MRLEGPLERLKAFARPAIAEERCGLCGTPVAPQHAHLLDVERHTLVCGCAACSLLFADGRGRHLPITPRAETLVDFAIDDATWDALAVPIGLCFFVRRGDAIVATYPSPAGPTEAVLPAQTWSLLLAKHPSLALAEHTEALLVQRLAELPSYHLVSIDRAWALAGLVRRHWRGFSGGEAMHEALARFFAELTGAHA